MSNFTGVSAEQIAQAIPFIDAEGRIDGDSVARQIAWYKSQNLLRGEVNASELIDSRYALLRVASK